MEDKGLRILFDSRDEKYKKPFGALKEGQVCFFNILVPVTCPAQKVYIVIEKDGENETYFEMQRGVTKSEYAAFETNLTLQEKGLYFYWFYIEKADGGFRLFKQGTRDTNIELGAKWQITCYDKNYSVPDWAKGAVIYQIFPDRFYKSGNPDLKDKIKPFKVYKNPSDCPEWYPDENGNWNTSFFGGNIKGITEKLDYIKELGADIIYLNPICKAFSSHRYDTADYKEIDPMLGTIENFELLCCEAHKKNIKIIIDGVFSHTGNKSVYFEDALKNENSPYRDWYDFKKFPNEYTSWWGIKSLPQIKKGHPGFMKFISKEIVPFWLSHGADGIRLDVADELTDEFIRLISKSAKKIKDALIIGEVWEDASNKISYGKRRKYLLGEEIDSVMNYPFLNAVINFVKCNITAEEFANEILIIAENYPQEILISCMNMLSTHDTIRILTRLGTDDLSKSKDEKAYFKLTEIERTNAEELLKIAVFIQFMLPGSPSIYYGDEICMEGFEDPFNRRFFEWDKVCCEMHDFYKKICNIKHNYPSLKRSKIKFECKNKVLVFFRNELEIIVNLTDTPFVYTGKAIIAHNTENDKVLKNGFALVKK